MDIDGAVQAELNKNDAAPKAKKSKAQPRDLAEKQSDLDRQSPTMKAAAKKPRKPPSKIAKAARPDKTKPKARPPVKAKRPKRMKQGRVRLKAAKLKAKKPAKKAGGSVVRVHRLDMRLSAKDKRKLDAKAKKTRRTITSIVLEAIEKIK